MAQCDTRLSALEALGVAFCLSGVHDRWLGPSPESEQSSSPGRRSRMNKGIMESVKDKMVGSIKGTGEVLNAAVDTVSGTLVTTIKGTGAVGTALTSAVSDVLRGAIMGTAQVGGDVGAAAKGGVVGVLKGTKEVGAETIDTVSVSARTLVKSAAEVGGDLGAVARNTVEGAISGAKQVGLNVEEAASAAATGAIKGAGEVSEQAVHQVRNAVTGFIAGVKAVLCPACLQRVLADRSLPSVRDGGDAITVDALGHEIITDRTGSPLSERLIRLGVSPLVRMALDEDARVRIRGEPRGGPVEVTPRRRAQLGTARVEVGDDDVKARRRRDRPAPPSTYHRPQPQHQIGVG